MSVSSIEQVEVVEDLPSRSRFAGLLSQDGLGRWTGLMLLVAGAIVLTIAWGRSSALADVPRQMPLIISGGFAGLGLVVVGVTLVAIDASVRRSTERRQRADAMTAAVERLRGSMGEHG